MEKPTVRFVSQKDMPQLVDLCEAHAIYEQATYDKTHKAEALKQHLFSENPTLYCLVIEANEALLGYATYMKQFATWDADYYVYMDCLFMREKARNKGYGELLVNKIQEETIKLGCTLIQWQTPDFNTRAIKFYNRIGAYSKSKERFFQYL